MNDYCEIKYILFFNTTDGIIHKRIGQRMADYKINFQAHLERFGDEDNQAKNLETFCRNMIQRYYKVESINNTLWLNSELNPEKMVELKLSLTGSNFLGKKDLAQKRVHMGL